SSPTPRRRPSPSSCSRSPSSRSSRSISSNAGASDTMAEPRAVTHLRAHDDPPAVKAALILAAVAVMAFFVVVPLVNVFVQAFAGGVGVYWRNLVADADTLHSIMITLMEAIGAEEEVAAVSLGARGWQMFRLITLPNIKWGLLYGVILCNARAMGEFGAVYVVSGHIAGKTDTMPLRVEKLFQEYNL